MTARKDTSATAELDALFDGGLPRAVLFDLDGTLIDSAPDLAGSVNAVLVHNRLAALPVDAIVAMIGDGIRALVERAFAAAGRPLDEPALDRAYDDMMKVYGAHLTDQTRLLPGVHALFEWLTRAAVPIGVVTNKPQRFTERILDHFGLSPLVAVAIGGDAGFQRKPAPNMLWAALSHLRVPPQEALMVGDSRADAASAHAGGIKIVLLRGGYSSIALEELGADLVLDGLPPLADWVAAVHARRLAQGARPDHTAW